MTEQRQPENALLRTGLNEVEALVTRTTATEVTVDVAYQRTGEIVGSATWTRTPAGDGRRWSVSLEGGWNTRTDGGRVGVKIRSAK